MPTVKGRCRGPPRAAAAATSSFGRRRRRCAGIQARQRAAPRFAWRSGTSRRTLSRAGECSWGPQRPDVPTWLKLVNFGRAAARAGGELNGRGLTREPALTYGTAYQVWLR